ncbi:low temperature requirement protein A [Gluconobacter sp. R75690]|uniref:low temperature requirement protein A n=1 Tax=unclassified Gluconobacter TaxID=2644261 RepID=UPI00188D43C1|nr:low temperature requirement protein A [Gluconobacter sp. R75690]MBF0879704.1 low temperature requirement protein A [Gluconobacter sp. R75828]
MIFQNRAGYSFLRQPESGQVEVTTEELFFDLIYVFLVTQISHGLLHHLGGMGFLQTLVLWFAAWLGWQYTGWITNWFDPRSASLRCVLFASMALALLCGAAAPEAFGARGLNFALCYTVMQTGRSTFVVCRLPRNHALLPNYQRILVWNLISSTFWIIGAFYSSNLRLVFWSMAVLCEYVSPMLGFWLPFLGRSRTSDWTISGSHLVERCQLFVMVALGETIMASGLSMARAEQWTAPVLLGFCVSFLCTVAMWWLYFGTSIRQAEHAIKHSSDPGRLGAYFHYIHAILIAGIIVTAVGMDILLENPLEAVSGPALSVMIAGPILYLSGSCIYGWIVTSRWSVWHLVGLGGFVILFFAGAALSPLVLCSIGTLMLLAVAWCVERGKRRDA